jgi:hypothetical protein
MGELAHQLALELEHAEYAHAAGRCRLVFVSFDLARRLNKQGRIEGVLPLSPAGQPCLRAAVDRRAEAPKECPLTSVL